MKDTITDPWSTSEGFENKTPEEGENCFEDSFTLNTNSRSQDKLPDSEEYLARLCN